MPSVLDLGSLAESVVDGTKFFGGAGALGETARVFAAGLRGECMSVRLPGIPFGEHIAKAADWWGKKFTGLFKDPAEKVRWAHDSVTHEIQDFLGVDTKPVVGLGKKPKLKSFGGPPRDGFMVSVPAWQDIFVFDNNKVFDKRSRKQRAMDYAEALRRSPTPPSMREVAEILTTLDDLQDEAATLAVVLMIAEKLAGRAIPGVGTVATIADALSVVYALSSLGTGSGVPGRRGKRVAKDRARHSSNGYKGRLKESRRVMEAQRVAVEERKRLKPDALERARDFKFGWGDWIQGLQATNSLFGFGIEIGPIMGFLQDAFWLGIRGGELRLPGRAVDPFGFTALSKSVCYRSPSLDEIHFEAYPVLANEAMMLWSHAGRVMPYIDILGEHALASTLYGLRLAEEVLGPWLRSGQWVEPLGLAIARIEVVPGGVATHETRGLRADEWVERTAPAVTAATMRAIRDVPDRGRQALYESWVADIGWGLLADLEPGVQVVDHGPDGFWRDAYTLLDAQLVPVFDLDD
jgi:hypothetical protein